MTTTRDRLPSPDGLRVLRSNDEDAVRRILSSLPEWFGIADANEEYFKAASVLPSYLAVINDAVVGVLLTTRHFDRSAEIFLIAVDAAQRHRGVGTALLDAAQAGLRAEGVQWLQVKTLGPSRPSDHYAQTRRFYERHGFAPLEELHNLWDENPCLLMVKTL
jgi:ribosomal protein S18 acetylase RimI-like enzyme